MHQLALLFILSYFSTLIFAQSCLRQLSPDHVVLNNGVRAPLQILQRQLKTKISHAHLTRTLYHYHQPSGILTACAGNLNLNLHQLSTRDTVVTFDPPAKVILNDEPQAPIHQGPVMKSAGRVNFAHDPITDQLIAVIAPGLHLQLVHSHLGYDLLVDTHDHRNLRDDNLFEQSVHPLSRALSILPSFPHLHRQRNSQGQSEYSPLADIAEVHQAWRPSCLARKLELEIMWDKSFCAKNFNDNFTTGAFQTRAVLFSTISIFEKFACVVITIIKFRVYCAGRIQDPLARPPSLDSCAPSSLYCSRPLRILETVRNLWWSQKVDFDTHDAVLFLSGYDDGTPIIGAAYVGGVCSKYRFGWVEGLEYAVIGHEIGHLLGASHSTSGLMKRVISLEEDPSLSKNSAQTIWNFVQKESNGWCLSRDSERRNARGIIQNFTLVQSADLVPLNFDLYFNRGFVGVRFMMVLRNKTDPGGALSFFTFTRDTLGGQELDDDTEYWNNTDSAFGPYQLPIEQPGEIACADVSLTQFAKPVVLTVRRLGYNVRALYQIGSNSGKKGIEQPKSWNRAFFVPVAMNGMRVQSCGIDTTLGQFLFAFARASNKPNRADIFYIVGRQMAGNGAMQNGWSRLIRVPVVVPGRVTSLGVTIYKVVADFEEDVIFSYIYVDGKGVSHMKIVVGFGLNADGTISGGWSGVVDYEPSIDLYTRDKVGFGIDVSPRELYNKQKKRNEKLRLPTLAFVDTIKELDYYRIVLQHEALANGMFNRANVTVNSELVPACEKCYSSFKAGKCVTFRLSCSEVNTQDYYVDYAISDRASEKDLAEFELTRSLQQKSRQSIETKGNDTYPGYPDRASNGGDVYCAGVFKLFIVKTGGECAGKVSEMWIATAGLAQLVESKLPDFVASDESVNVSKVELLVEFNVDGASSEDELPGGFADHVRNKGPSNIQIFYWRKLRRESIRSMLKGVLKAKDYGFWFQRKTQPVLKIVPIKKGKYKFLHTISFPWVNFG